MHLTTNIARGSPGNEIRVSVFSCNYSVL